MIETLHVCKSEFDDVFEVICNSKYYTSTYKLGNIEGYVAGNIHCIPYEEGAYLLMTHTHTWQELNI